MTIIIAAAFGLAVSKGYSVKHTVDPLPEDKNHSHDEEEENERTKSKQH